MENLALDSKVTLMEAYLIMFDYLNKYWHETGKDNAIANLLGELSLWDTEKGKAPMDAAIFPTWLSCANSVLEQQQTELGYRNADISLQKDS